VSRDFDHGVVIGKFLPYHRGHKHLIAAAEQRCNRVSVIACGESSQAIPVELRGSWIAATHPAVDVHLVDQDDLGLADDDSAGWARATIDVLGAPPDAVFTSEDYGDAYAGFLGCRHILVDRDRLTVPVSGSAIRADPLEHLNHLEPIVRAYYVQRVCVLGAESTGKTTLAGALADAVGTVWAAEFGHMYQALGRDDPNAGWSSAEFSHVARLHAWLEDFQASQANRVVICDTDAFTTALWHEAFVGTRAPEDVLDLARTRRYDLYLLCDMDIPFRQDAYELRDDGPRRLHMQERYLERLNGQSTPWLLLSGSLEQRIARASDAIRSLPLPPR
jgi:HTH-type transcriptional repressor of NAD biosynthesis genes